MAVRLLSYIIVGFGWEVTSAMQEAGEFYRNTSRSSPAMAYVCSADDRRPNLGMSAKCLDSIYVGASWICGGVSVLKYPN